LQEIIDTDVEIEPVFVTVTDWVELGAPNKTLEVTDAGDTDMLEANTCIEYG